MIKFAYTILYVAGVTASIQFYEQVFGLQSKFIVPDGSYAELVTGETTLSFASLELAAGNLKAGFIRGSHTIKPFPMEIAFSTDDVAGLYEKAIGAGAVAESAPEVKPHGQTVSYVRDPDGFLIEICTPMF